MNDKIPSMSVRDPQELARFLVSRQRAGDVDGVTALYKPNVVLHIGDGKVAYGRDAIRSFYADLVASGRKIDSEISVRQ